MLKRKSRDEGGDPSVVAGGTITKRKKVQVKKPDGISDSSVRNALSIPDTPPGLSFNQRKNWRRQQRRLALKRQGKEDGKGEWDVEVASRTELGVAPVKVWEAGADGAEALQGGRDSEESGSESSEDESMDDVDEEEEKAATSGAELKSATLLQASTSKGFATGSPARPKSLVEVNATSVPVQSGAAKDPEAGLKRLGRFLGESDGSESESEEEEESGDEPEQKKTPQPLTASTIEVVSREEGMPIGEAPQPANDQDITQVLVVNDAHEEPDNDDDDSTSASEEDSINGELRAVESQQSFRPSEEAESEDEGDEDVDVGDDDLMREAAPTREKTVNGTHRSQIKGREATQDSDDEEESDAEAKALGEIRVVRERSSPDMRRQLLDDSQQPEEVEETASQADSEAASSDHDVEAGEEDAEEEEEAEPSEPDLSQLTPRSSSRWSFLGHRPGGEHSRHSRRRTDEEGLVLATASPEVLYPPSQQNEKQTNEEEDSKENVSPSHDGDALFGRAATTPEKKRRRDQIGRLSSQLSTPPDSCEKKLHSRIDGPAQAIRAFPLYTSIPNSQEIPPTPSSAFESDGLPSAGPDQQSHEEEEQTPARKKRKMTGITSKHFSPQRQTRSRTKRTEDEGKAPDEEANCQEEEQEAKILEPAQAEPETKHSEGEKEQEELTATHRRKPPKRTPTKSNYFLPLDRVDLPSPSSRPRIPGVSHAPIPPISSPHFGIIQEKLAAEPFWLLVAVILLNKTTGRAAIPTFWELRKKYGSVEGLANADVREVSEMIYCCGLYNQRGKGIVGLAKGWAGLGMEGDEEVEGTADGQPRKGVRFRCLHYPRQGDGKRMRKKKDKKGEEQEEGIVQPEVVPEDDGSGDREEVKGFLEIAHLKGCGRYAYDSWRIFCRDVLRGVATGYNGEGREEDETFEPEWKRVLPQDKELRATVRWMWLKEGWIWNCETGVKRQATEDEMERARKGEMDVPDGDERKFAERAVGLAG